MFVYNSQFRFNQYSACPC